MANRSIFGPMRLNIGVWIAWGRLREPRLPATALSMRVLGKTGIEVPIVGLGAGAIGDIDHDEGAITYLVHRAIEMGVTLFDSARSYGASEERLGRALRDRRSQVVLST